MRKLKSLYRQIVHGLIVRYLYKCGGAFHYGEYGDSGRYVKIFTDETYNQHQNDMIKRGSTY